jgi:hypothetical protein
MIGVLASEIAAGTSLAVAIVGLAAGIAFASRPMNRAAPAVLAILWAVRAGAAVAIAGNTASWVAAAEAGMIAVSMLTLASRDTDVSGAADMLARAVASAMLLLFAYVHVFQTPAIAALIPEWLPGGSILPLVSGGVMALAGILLWVRRLATGAALAVATMFMAWLPLIHAPRLWRDPGSPSEWAFVSMAMCLAGCLLIVGRGRLPVRQSRLERPALSWDANLPASVFFDVARRSALIRLATNAASRRRGQI